MENERLTYSLFALGLWMIAIVLSQQHNRHKVLIALVLAALAGALWGRALWKVGSGTVSTKAEQAVTTHRSAAPWIFLLFNDLRW